MKCLDVRKMLSAYLDNEATPLEQKQLRDHIIGCADCRDEMAALSGLQSHLHRALKIEAAQVAPSQHAWRRLQARLADEPAGQSAHESGLVHRLVLLGSNHRQVNWKNKPTSNITQGRSPGGDSAAERWWHHGLAWAAKWSRKSKTGEASKKPLAVRNRQTTDGQPDGSAE
jgi:hypothetical protein